jgi:hypothetical protein
MVTRRSRIGRNKKRNIHDYVFPHKGNAYTPHIFRAGSLAFLVLGVLVLQAAYFTQINFVFPKTNFLAAVLPSALVDLTNTDRASNNLGPVGPNTTLDQAAQAAADDMANKGYFAHVSPTGTTPWNWLNQVGYQYQYAGENLAVNFTDSDQVETAWMNSPTHRANILKSQYTQVGVGVANGTYEGKDATFVVQFFAAPEPTGTSAATQTPVQESASSTTSRSSVIALASTTGTAEVSNTIKTSTTTQQVLGTETSHTSQDVAENAVSSSSPASSTPVVSIASQKGPQAGIGAFFAQVTTSPRQTIIYIFATLTALVLVLLIIELSVKARLKYVEMTSGGFAFLILLLVVLVFNVVSTPQVQVSSGAEITTEAVTK